MRMPKSCRWSLERSTWSNILAIKTLAQYQWPDKLAQERQRFLLRFMVVGHKSLYCTWMMQNERQDYYTQCELVFRVGQNRIHTPYIVYLMKSLPKVPHTHRLTNILANPTIFDEILAKSTTYTRVTKLLSTARGGNFLLYLNTTTCGCSPALSTLHVLKGKGQPSTYIQGTRTDRQTYTI